MGFILRSHAAINERLLDLKGTTMHEPALNDRIRQIRQRMRDQAVDFLLLVRPSHVSYVTGFMGQDSWAALTDKRLYLLTDSRYAEQAEKECPTCQIIERTSTLAQTAGHVADLAEARTVGFDRSISVADWDLVRKHWKGRIKTLPNPVAPVRAIKEPGEIGRIRKAGLITRKALAQALPDLRPGITENAFAGLLDYQFRRLGATAAFDTIVAFGPNASRPHHRPTGRRLRSEDTVLIDFGARYQGYCSDITRSLAVGEPSELFLKAFDVVGRAQAAALDVMRPGTALAEVDAAARGIIRASGLPLYGHGSGHGIGLDIHEDPFLKPDAQGVLKAGHLLTIEPGVYLPGRLGVRLEDDILVTPSGPQILTRRGPHSFRLAANAQG
jgi:Xaa-Pro aminopeptidase